MIKDITKYEKKDYEIIAHKFFVKKGISIESIKSLHKDIKSILELLYKSNYDKKEAIILVNELKELGYLEKFFNKHFWNITKNIKQ